MARGVRQKWKLEGLRELEAALLTLSKATAVAVLRRTLKAAAAPIAGDAQMRAPVDSQWMAERIHAGTRLNKRQSAIARKQAGTYPRPSGKAWRSSRRKGVEIYVGPPASARAVVQEFGSTTNPPQPFLRPAWLAGRDKAAGRIKAELAWQIGLAAARAARRQAALITKVKRGA